MIPSRGAGCGGTNNFFSFILILFILIAIIGCGCC
ncbi:MAG TPA: sporulation protein YjcZ [Firmicutes bacterium]|nr:sporulation protein YjcZ [Bacillota bacterium]HAW99979.1 sporulation protein YjcZ [Bacillota bacterium]